MATPPTFSSGSVLTAAQMNSVGLWLVKTQTIGTGVTTETVTGAFSTDFDNYKIVVSKVAVSATGSSAFLKFGGSTGFTYFANGWYMTPTSGTLNPLNFNAVNTGIWIGISGGTTSWSFDVCSPFLASATNVVGMSAGSGANYYNNFVGSDSNAASSTAFSLTQATSNWTGGTIAVYGYRK
jgi:hypothetical protein